MPFTPAQREQLERLLANEADMAFRRRVPILLEYLELGDGTQVLDAGCGTGFYLVAIETLTGASTTIDVALVVFEEGRVSHQECDCDTDEDDFQCVEAVGFCRHKRCMS